MVKNRRLRPTSSGNEEVDKALDEIRDAVQESQFPYRIIEDVTLTDGVTSVIPHKLGRKLQGWIICRCNATGVTFRDYQLTSSRPEQFLYLRPVGGSPKVSILVF